MDKCHNCGKEEEKYFVTVLDYKEGGFCSTKCMSEFMINLINKQRQDAVVSGDEQ